MTRNLIQVKQRHQQRCSDTTDSQSQEPITQLESDDILPLSPGNTSMCSMLCGGDVRAEYERGASPNLGDSPLSTVTNTHDPRMQQSMTVKLQHSKKPPSTVQKKQ